MNEEAIKRLAVTTFKLRCEQHPEFLRAPEVIMQIVYDEMFYNSPHRPFAERQSGTGNREKER